MTDENKTPKDAPDTGSKDNETEAEVGASADKPPEPEFPPIPEDFMTDKPAEDQNLPPIPDAAADPVAAPAADTNESKPFLSDDDALPMPGEKPETDGSTPYEENVVGSNPVPDMDDPIFDYLGPAPKKEKPKPEPSSSGSVLPPDSFDEAGDSTDKKPKRERTADGSYVNKDILDAEKELEEHLVKKGDVYNLTEKTPSLNSVIIGAGWDQRAFEEDSIDADLSIFLLNKDGQTRVDEDFVFYNQPKALEMAVEHLTDSRTGAGEGDDEDIRINLHEVPFDITNIMIVISIYDPEYIGHRLDMLKNCFIRIFENDENRRELVRYKIEDEDLGDDTNGFYAAQLLREGPIWKFQAIGDPVTGGLAKIASDYGIIIKELQSTATSEG